MSAKKLKVVVTRKLPAPVELRLKELFDARLNNDDHPFTQEELVEAMQTADGAIAQAVARRAKAFGLQIHYHNRKPVSPRIEELLEATYWDSLDQMLARMDIVSVNCPHTPATFHLMNARRIELMKPESYIVNTARGEVIDEAALARALKAGKIAGAGLDVFEPTVNEELFGLPNVVLLPHMGSATIEGRTEMGEKVIINIKTFADGHRPPDRVIPAIL